MRLFAERGARAVSVRDIAVAAGVSPSLVIHHYKSKDGLKAAVDERATATLTDVVAELAQAGPIRSASASLAAKFAANLEAQPVLPAYVRRMLVDGGPAAEALFRSLFHATVKAVDALQEAGAVRSAADDPTRAAFLLVNDLAVIILREQIGGVLGIDPLSGAGMARWTETVLDVYGSGLFTSEALGEEA